MVGTVSATGIGRVESRPVGGAIYAGPVAAADGQGSGFGANSWLVEEMYEEFVRDPESVGESWREFFADYHSGAPSVAAAAAASPQVRAVAVGYGAEVPDVITAPPPSAGGSRGPSGPRRTRADRAGRRAGDPPPPAASTDDPGKPIRGAAAAIASNMARSLDVPTATSFRNVPAKLLEVNRKVINGYRARVGHGQGQLHPPDRLRARPAIADDVPNMKNAFVEGADGKAPPRHHDHVNMGLAVDVDKGDGTARWSCPCSSTPTRSTSRLPRRLRRDHPQGPEQQADDRRLRGGERHAHQPGHDRHRAVGARG